MKNKWTFKFTRDERWLSIHLIIPVFSRNAAYVDGLNENSVKKEFYFEILHIFINLVYIFIEMVEKW